MMILGFDFGTTNSVFAEIRDGRVITYTDDDDRPIPSIITYEGDRKIIGRLAKERLQEAGRGVFGNTIRSPKMLLEKDAVTVDGVSRKVVDIVSDLMAGLVNWTRSRIESSSDLPDRLPVVITIPVDFKGGQRRLLRAAATAAGLDIVQFIHEPFAALYGYLRRQPESSRILRELENQYLLVYDWGGGTLDINLCRLLRGQLVQIDSDGTDSLGGDHFDTTIQNHVIERFLSESGTNVDEIRIDPDARTRLLHDCERVKIELSSRKRALLYEDFLFPDLKDPALEYEIAQEELEEVVRPLINNGLNRLERLLERNNVARQEISLALATGGMSRMPAIERRLRELFGTERLKMDSAGGVAMAEGAAFLASDDRPLRLSRSIELQVARSGFLPLVKSGDPMPRGGSSLTSDLTLWCTDPRDGEARFHLVSPKTASETPPPHEERDSLGIATLDVDSNRNAFDERIQLRTEIDEDLILTISAESGLTASKSDPLEIHHLQFGIQLDEPTA